MGLGDTVFWLFLAAVVVGSLTFVTVLVWATKRFEERQEFYRFEFRKRLVDSGEMDAAAFASLVQYEHEAGLQQSRQKLLVAAFIFVGIGFGTCVGLSFLDGAVWRLGLIPLSMGLCMLFGGLLFIDKTNPGPPPVGVSPKPDGKE